MTERCAKQVYGDTWGGHRCVRKGINCENGMWWCKQHTPSLVKIRDAEREAKWQAKWDAERAAREVKRWTLEELRKVAEEWRDSEDAAYSDGDVLGFMAWLEEQV